MAKSSDGIRIDKKQAGDRLLTGRTVAATRIVNEARHALWWELELLPDFVDIQNTQKQGKP